MVVGVMLLLSVRNVHLTVERYTTITTTANANAPFTIAAGSTTTITTKIKQFFGHQKITFGQFSDTAIPNPLHHPKI